ncbi:transcriptional regulator with XRE-family HTH domain [Thermocatellispora tengchongensis]|uniref:Transcriptional regulator with XRE-family HTH domain n=1 Tax=Thermocatellispora tengchongensis TaxID=1073253 RepID=A0A840PNT2_9ACTN|nr:helix-turn-helix transcriptional regulator [Thermocatellispora tengchongensis]MBB5137685.1 transcriptional regulator with XRE-family HTH domain [Thermocatellispora tengchongensis]
MEGVQGAVPERGSPSVRRRRLGQELRRLRERAGLTGDQVAESLKWSASKVSRIETAKTMPRRADVQALTELYAVGEDKQRELVDLQADAARKGWWEEYQDALPEEYTTLLGLEEEATFERNWEPQIVPGLFQTPEYAEEVIRAAQVISRIPPADIRTRVEARLARQKLLTRDGPLTVWVVMDESALLRRFGGATVMREQIERLIEVSRMPNVRLQILPQEAFHPVNTGSFIHLEFSEFQDVVYLETLLGGRWVENRNEVFEYQMAFDNLRSEALGPEASRELMQKIIARWK